MTAQPDLIGTVTLTEDETFTVAGVDLLLAEVLPGDEIRLPAKGLVLTIGEVTSAAEGALTDPCPSAAAGEDQPCRIRYQPAASRYTAQVRNLVGHLGSGNLTALAGLVGAANALPMFSGAGAMTLLHRGELVEGVHFDAQVADLAGREAHDEEVEGFSVLVADTGDGRAALYVKESLEIADWSAPAYITGPRPVIEMAPPAEGDFGSAPNVEATLIEGGLSFQFTLPAGPVFTVGDVTTVAPGEPAEFDLVPVTGGYRFDLSLPAGEDGEDGDDGADGQSFEFEGEYNAGLAYEANRIVMAAGSAWIAKRAVAIGDAPPVLPMEENDDWRLFVRAGANGEMTGPVEAVVGHVAVFADGTGDTVADGGPMRARHLPESYFVDDHDITPDDAGRMLVFDKGGSAIVTLPPIAASAGELYSVRNVSNDPLTISTDDAELIDGEVEIVVEAGHTVRLWPDAARADWRVDRGGSGGGSTGGREMLAADRTYYVRTDGSDGNDGLNDEFDGAFLTIQKAVDVIAATLDVAGFTVTIQIGDGTYTDPVVLKNVTGFGGAGTMIIKGNAGAPANVLVSTSGAHGFSAAGLYTVFDIFDLKIETSAAGSACCISAVNSEIRFGNVVFGAAHLAHVRLIGGSSSALSNYTIAGSATRHLICHNGSFFDSSLRTVTLTGTPAFATRTYECRYNSVCFLYTMTFSGGATGQRFFVGDGSVIHTNGGGANYLPGNAAGSGNTFGSSPFGLYQ